MGVWKALDKLRAGYPGGWKQYARGTNGTGPAPFTPPTDPDDRRSLIPPLGLREYWYPALPAKDVGGKKPVGLRICGIDLVFFRDTQGAVQALWDYCPHRGAYLSWGDCFWKGYVSCPYHGATFDGQGECVEFITEGPESKMPGRLKARKFPTVTLKGIVFVWMGEGEPVSPEEDIPPELFEEKTEVRYSFTYWPVNWMIALENNFDAHNFFYVHRDSLVMLRKRLGGLPRTPVGYRVKVTDKNVNAIPGAERYYAQNGKIPYQLYYPRVGGYWPLHGWRLLWTWLTEWIDARQYKRPRFETPPEWQGTRLPGMVRLSHWDCFFTRWVIPVEADLTRLVYFCSHRPTGIFDRVYRRITWPSHNYIRHYNFSNQDNDAIQGVRWQYPEFLSSTDSFMVAVRKLVTEHARGIRQPEAVPKKTMAERLVDEADEIPGAKPGAKVPAGDKKKEEVPTWVPPYLR